MNNKKAIIFARVSTRRQETEGLSIKKIQLPRAYDYAKKNNLEIIKEFAISETGGSYKMRAKFKEMIDYVTKNKDITHIISFRVDRITRNFHDAVAIDDLRFKNDKIIHFIDDNLILHKNSKSNDLLQWDMKVLFARQYLERVREDGNNTKYSKLERGELPWRAPYGYKHYKSSDKKIKTVILKQPEATIVSLIHTKYSTNLYSCQSLANAINEEFNTNLNKGKIQVILRNKFYIGVMIDKKTNKEYLHNYEKLVNTDIFDLNQSILDGNKSQIKKHSSVSAVYRGLIKCNFCGCSVTPDRKIKKQKNGNIHEYIYYHCTNGKRLHKNSIKYIRETEINNSIKKLLHKLRIPEAKLKEIQRILKESHNDKIAFYEAQRKEIMQERRKLSNRKQNMYDLLADKCITPQEYTENNERYDEELSKLQRKEERLDNADKQFYLTISYLLSLIQHAEELFEVAEINEKREILNLLLSNLKLDDKNINLTLKEPFASIVSNANGSLWWAIRDSNPRPPRCKRGALAN